MGFMQLQITQKGRLYSCECAKCGTSMYSHEWATWDNNEMRDAMEEGTALCQHCGGRADPETFWDCGMQYAGRYSAPGYLDCTDWTFDTNKRRLERELRAMYSPESI
jgi:hypothetical protein